MKIETQKLIDLLQEVEPALSASNMMPIMSHFWFTGSSIQAYGDQARISISVPFKSDFKGALPRTILPMLISTAAKEIEITAEDEVVKIKAASSTMKFAMLDASGFVFKMPKHSGKKFPVNADQFLSGIENCLRSIGNSTATSSHMGVNVHTFDDEMLMLTTTTETLSYSCVGYKGKVPFPDRVILNAEFCRQLLRIAKGTTDAQLKLEVINTNEVTGVLLEHEGTLLFGEILENDDQNLVEYFDKYVPNKLDKQFFIIHEKLESVLTRACIITEAAIDKTRTEVSVREGKVRFLSKSERGEVTDSMLVDGAKHADVVLHIDPKAFKDGYGSFARMAFTEQAAIMQSDDKQKYYVVAALG